jgi:transcriptional regulator with XRE-family HTH domain
MAKPLRSHAKYLSRIALIRIARGVTQRELADAVGVSHKTLRRLESGQMEDPSLALLTNCALALKVRVEQITEPSWSEWKPLRADRTAPPDPDTFFKPGRLKLPLWAEKVVEPDLE